MNWFGKPYATVWLIEGFDCVRKEWKILSQITQTTREQARGRLREMRSRFPMSKYRLIKYAPAPGRNID